MHSEFIGMTTKIELGFSKAQTTKPELFSDFSYEASMFRAFEFFSSKYNEVLASGLTLTLDMTFTMNHRGSIKDAPVKFVMPLT